jgi:hypothetical protein
MKHSPWTIALLSAAALLGPALAEEAAPTPPARSEIPFANHGGIWDWRADGPDAILIKSRSGHYYRATLMSPCFSLPFAQTVGFVTDPRDVLDRFSSIDVHGQNCAFTSFAEIPKPEKW